MGGVLCRFVQRRSCIRVNSGLFSGGAVNWRARASVNIFNKELFFQKFNERENRNWAFWSFQLSGWCAYTLVTFFSFTYLENDIAPFQITHLLMQAFLGVLCTWPLRSLYGWSFKLSVGSQIALALVASSLLALVWTCLRIPFFIWISGLPDMWEEFNEWFYGALFVFWSWSALYFVSKYYLLHKMEHGQLLEEITSKKEEQLKRLQAESSTREAQLQMLRYQLNPHFLFNALNSINALVVLQENDKAQIMIQQLSGFLRHSLDNDTIENVTLEDELEMLMLYLNIEKTRFEERLAFEFEIEPEAKKAIVPSLILQPIFENSLKYAVAASESGGAIRMTAQVAHNELNVTITDTGPGINAGEVSQGRGIGLSNIQKRLQVAYTSGYTFEASVNDAAGFSVAIRIPYEIAVNT